MPNTSTSYVAFIRGVGPENPNMSHAAFTAFFRALGLSDIQVVQSSGNIIFRSSLTNPRTLEKRIETELPKRLGFSRSTIVRSQADLQAIVDATPFAGLQHGPETACNLVFIKNPAAAPTRYSFVAPDKSFRLKAAPSATIACIHQPKILPTPKLMAFTEKTFGRDSTMRTWNTVVRILGKMAGDKIVSKKS